MTRGEFADHLRDLRAVEWRKRDDAMVRAHAPVRAELRPRRRNKEQRRLRAAFCERAQEIERGRIGPVQVLEGEHDRLRPRARQNLAVIAASCRRRNSSGVNCARRSSGNGTSTSGASRGAYSPASRPTSCRVFSRSARRCSAGRSAPNRRRPHSAIGCSGVFCNNCDDDHSTHVWGVSPSRPRNSSISLDFPRPGSPTISASWPSPLRTRSQRRLRSSSSSSRPTRGVKRTRAAAPAAAAREGLFVFPLMLVYTAVSYSVFRGKVRPVSGDY